MNMCIFLTTRINSTRMPEKPLLAIGEDSVTDILIERLKETGLPIIMTVPDMPDDNIYMKNIADKHKIGFYAGNKENIIQRHIDCCEENEVDWVINIDGDDILACPDLILSVSKMIEANEGGECIYLSGYPLGLNILAYTPERLSKVDYAKDTNWGKKIMDIGDFAEIKGTGFNDCRLTLDYFPDLIVMNHIVKALGKKADSSEICKFMSEHPEICTINNYLNKQYFERLEQLSKEQ